MTAIVERSDPYAASGEFLDIFSEPAWQLLREPVTAALRGVVAAHGPLVDLGAGTGLGTRILAAACPATPIVAVEPSTVLRAVLLSRIDADADLRDRVTVVAAGAGDVALPQRMSGMAAFNMIGHLDAEERRTLWRRVAARLAPGAPLVVNVQPPSTAAPVPYTTFAEVPIGDHVYVGGGAAEPAGPNTVLWRMRYTVQDRTGMPIRSVAVDYRWHVVSPAALLDELSVAGLSGEAGPHDVIRAVVADHRMSRTPLQ